MSINFVGLTDDESALGVAGSRRVVLVDAKRRSTRSDCSAQSRAEMPGQPWVEKSK